MHALATETLETRQDWPPAACPPWCSYSDTHEGRDYPDDRKHFGVEVRVPLSLEPAIKMGDGEFGCESLQVYLRQHETQSVPQITLAKGEGVGVTMTLHEAAALAGALNRVIAESGDESTAAFEERVESLELRVEGLVNLMQSVGSQLVIGAFPVLPAP
jgi:hypothetical protein